MKFTLITAATFSTAFITAQSKQDSIKLKDIQEVIVIARKPTVENKVDRTVFNVANSSILSGNTTWDVLRITPLVSIDSDDVIKAEGQSVTVYINDRKSVFSGKELKEYLNTIPADNLMKIEVITSPSSKYETTGEVINIVLKRLENEGLKGSASFTNNQSSKNSQYSNLNINYHKKNFTQNLTAGYNDNTNFYKRDSESLIYDNNALTLFNAESTSTDRSPSFSSTSEIELSEKNNVGLILEYRKSKRFSDMNSYGSSYINGNLQDSFTKTQNLEGDYQNVGTNVFYKYYDKVKNKILDVNAGINYRLSDDQNDHITNFTSTPVPLGSRIYNHRQDREYYVKVDYSQPIGDSGSQLEFGGKTSFKNNVIPYDYLNLIDHQWTFDQSRTNNFQYTDNLNSLYANISKTFFKKLETRIGLRFEYLSYTVKQEVSNVERSKSYSTILPDLLLKYAFSDNYSLSATYNHNLWRPYFSEFNPFLLPSDEGMYYRGNLDLQPNPSDRLGLKLGIKKKYFLSANYFFSNHDYWTSYVIEDGKTISTPTNFDGRIERLSGNFSTNQTFFKNKFTVNLNIGVEYSDSSDFNIKNNLNIKNYITNFSGSSNMSYTNLLGKNINLNAWVGVYSQNGGNSVSNKQNIFHSLSATKIFTPLQMEATVRLNNFLFKPNFDSTTYAPIGQFRYNFASDWYGISFSLVKRFGNQKVKENTKTNVEKDSGGAK
ncbi:TonB-dependent receptor [Kaistella flava (ex Peng et al. 2021)]|uniref:TonB-dependent receptor n=1 Tax=Kaistella flava (ex Peng et al. 2021) TaxID=2038776 RepID=A0A7M2Y6I5_9FLAO|nr:outer membrane beta-barrel family protein [Kaistella flava (ex Peng et al. 2021)]QOW09858.1 TonB-dependent receptor [Kaistella flava (ex Peng et al. 2021)]